MSGWGSIITETKGKVFRFHGSPPWKFNKHIAPEKLHLPKWKVAFFIIHFSGAHCKKTSGVCKSYIGNVEWFNNLGVT